MGLNLSKTINDRIWLACDIFRGVIDAHQYKDYILVMFFLKYISDLRKSLYEKYLKEYAGNDERIRRKLENERFVLPMVELKDQNNVVIDSFLASYDLLLERKDRDNIGELINIVLDQIENKNRKMLAGLFRHIDFNSEAYFGKHKDRNRRLKELITLFSHADLDLSPARVSQEEIGEAYMSLIERFGFEAGKKAGEFFTPAQVSKLVAKLALPKAGHRIADITAGSGNLLLRCAKEIIDIGSFNFSLYGQESNSSTWALCRMNMLLHGIDSARIEWCDTLIRPALVENDELMKFNTIIANPPFSLKNWRPKEYLEDPYHRFYRGLPPASNADWAFISHMVEIALDFEGRICVVVPLGVLFRGGVEQKIRETLIKENLVDAVIALPEKLFLTSSIPIAVLILDKSRQKGGLHGLRQDIMFINASQKLISGKSQNYLADEHIEEIMSTYLNRKDVERFAKVVSVKEVLDLELNDANLNVSRYVDTYEAEEFVDIFALQKEIALLDNELSEIRSIINNTMSKLVISQDQSKKRF
jgi:type I restriction enzyme M protein